MLLDFKMRNFKSFYQLTDFSMMAQVNKKDNAECLLNLKNGNITRKVLPSSVVYGGNACGKTSLIGAINLMKQIVINGTIKSQIENKYIRDMSIDTFIHDYKKSIEPVHLEITFKTEKNIYNYIIECICSYNQSKRIITKEELSIVNYKKSGNSVH